MAELTKEQLHEAYALAKSMGNAFRAFKEVDTVVSAVIQARQEQERLEATKEKILLEVENARKQLAREKDLLSAVRQDLETEAERLAAYRGAELAKIAEELAKATAAAEQELVALQQEILQAKKDLSDAMADKNAAMLMASQEIANKKKILEGLKAELSAIAAKIGG